MYIIKSNDSNISTVHLVASLQYDDFVEAVEFAMLVWDVLNLGLNTWEPDYASSMWELNTFRYCFILVEYSIAQTNLLKLYQKLHQFYTLHSPQKRAVKFTSCIQGYGMWEPYANKSLYSQAIAALWDCTWAQQRFS